MPEWTGQVDPERPFNVMHSPRPERGPWRKRERGGLTCTSCCGDEGIEFDCKRYFIWLIGAFFTVLSVHNATQVPWFALERPSTDTHPDPDAGGLEAAPNWHALLGYRGAKLWADPALFHAPHAALLAIILMMLAVSWLRFRGQGREMLDAVQGRRVFHLSDHELADPELAPGPDPRAGEEDEEIEVGFTGQSLDKPFVTAALLMFLHALPVVGKHGLPHLGPAPVWIGLVFSLLGSLTVLARSIVEKKIDGGLAKQKKGVLPHMPEEQLHKMCREHGVRIVDGNAHLFSIAALLDSLIPLMRNVQTDKYDRLWKPLLALCWTVIGAVVLSEAVPEFYEVIAGVLSWVGLSTISTDLAGDCERVWCDRVDPDSGWLVPGGGDLPHELSGHGPYAWFGGAISLSVASWAWNWADQCVGAVISTALLIWWCRLTKRLLCASNATRRAVSSESYHELPRDGAIFHCFSLFFHRFSLYVTVFCCIFHPSLLFFIDTADADADAAAEKSSAGGGGGGGGAGGVSELSSAVNFLERQTGVDLDGDGDIGVDGEQYPRQPQPQPEPEPELPRYRASA